MDIVNLCVCKFELEDLWVPTDPCVVRIPLALWGAGFVVIVGAQTRIAIGRHMLVVAVVSIG